MVDCKARSKIDSPGKHSSTSSRGQYIRYLISRTLYNVLRRFSSLIIVNTAYFP
jgi:hypothetical protein